MLLYMLRLHSSTLGYFVIEDVIQLHYINLSKAGTVASYHNISSLRYVELNMVCKDILETKGCHNKSVSLDVIK